ncbi:precorrin-4 C(11)-methyltransferase [Xylanibacter ruminicola]|uniref:Cobalamin biosynthesis protein CbiG/precorrin-4 C11-methyltransferase n=2 Tax=Xylanibacter ruminicola TaxID=839 RepID=D5ES11_XYLR2|nr:precorrin-4 C(11)-methyltransferase [Xylanibacter ruminicola]ADE81693.1 cobalamin biosynthesis protein CbiG/precorrin-4 C11-methyltransferase [Xylanibacter ruminicola 23]GJG33516.1 precorrin-4 C(11)-methyltransferase [Xylanibacter ruminicola]SEH71529.1 precorrin-4 C11-methyltransferase [Xylanibacter ruminicola]
MQKIAIIQISDAGSEIASQLQCELGAELIQRTDVGNQWAAYDAFVFIGAMGICVRTIAPYIEDKHTDPAVVCIDSFGLNVISVLSGHIGGANDLTRHIAAHLGAHEVITTQSDNAGLWALDTLDKQFNWNMVGFDDINACISAFVNREPTALLMDIRDAGTDFLERTLPDHVTIVNSIDEVTPKRFRLLIQVTPYIIDTPPGVLKVCYVPKVGVLGFGLASHPANYEHILEEIDEAITDNDIMPCYKRFCTIDVKRDEEFCAKLQKETNSEVVYYTGEELAKVEVPNPSETVEKHVGTPSVCEAAAILGSNHGKLILPKIKGKNWTAALAIDHKYLREQKGHIEIVGAGPGDPDLVSVRGRKMLERADLILYAGSLVPKALTECHKPGAVVRSSADMALEEQCELMKKFYDEGKFIVRLHTGDPCIFGAIQEQMAFFDANHMEYHITPGISSFLAAAAELQSQFTIPERCQTIILTRGEGRTPMPEKEQLHLLAKSQSTMCIFLSASIVDDVQRELLQEYPEDTPVAACYHLTWPDQKIYRGVLKDLAQIVHDNHLTLTTMLVVGEAIDNRQGLSELYSKNFTHLFRKGKA